MFDENGVLVGDLVGTEEFLDDTQQRLNRSSERGEILTRDVVGSDRAQFPG